MKCNALLKGLVLLSVVWAAGVQSAEAPAATDPWGLTDFAGKSVTLDQHAGKHKWLIVMFWAHDCGVCNKEAHEYLAFHNKHKNKDATVLGVSLDGKAGLGVAKEFVARHKLTFPNLIGEPNTISTMYFHETGEAWFGTPTFMIYNPDGGLVAKQAGAVPVPIIEEFMASYAAEQKAAEKAKK